MGGGWGGHSFLSDDISLSGWHNKIVQNRLYLRSPMVSAHTLESYICAIHRNGTDFWKSNKTDHPRRCNRELLVSRVPEGNGLRGAFACGCPSRRLGGRASSRLMLDDEHLPKASSPQRILGRKWALAACAGPHPTTFCKTQILFALFLLPWEHNTMFDNNFCKSQWIFKI